MCNPKWARVSHNELEWANVSHCEPHHTQWITVKLFFNFVWARVNQGEPGWMRECTTARNCLTNSVLHWTSQFHDAMFNTVHWACPSIARDISWIGVIWHLLPNVHVFLTSDFLHLWLDTTMIANSCLWENLIHTKTHQLETLKKETMKTDRQIIKRRIPHWVSICDEWSIFGLGENGWQHKLIPFLNPQHCVTDSNWKLHFVPFNDTHWCLTKQFVF